MQAAVRATRLVLNNSKSISKCITSSVRNHGTYSYRTAPPPPPRQDIIYANIMGGVMWWWILWHLYTEPDHLIGGHWDEIEPSKWTDEELGIPPDSEGLGGRTPIMH